jgi:hypothetical protein
MSSKIAIALLTSVAVIAACAASDTSAWPEVGAAVTAAAVTAVADMAVADMAAEAFTPPILVAAVTSAVGMALPDAPEAHTV